MGLVIVLDENCTKFKFEVMDLTLFLFFLGSQSMNKSLDPVTVI